MKSQNPPENEIPDNPAEETKPTDHECLCDYWRERYFNLVDRINEHLREAEKKG